MSSATLTESAAGAAEITSFSPFSSSSPKQRDSLHNRTSKSSKLLFSQASSSEVSSPMSSANDPLLCSSPDSSTTPTALLMSSDNALLCLSSNWRFKP
uniref:Uncharacterized protein n=1 Tax=Arundo donax TaxID=35708 RepID=A0A0A8YFJ7_ARUDO